MKHLRKSRLATAGALVAVVAGVAIVTSAAANDDRPSAAGPSPAEVVVTDSAADRAKVVAKAAVPTPSVAPRPATPVVPPPGKVVTQGTSKIPLGRGKRVLPQAPQQPPKDPVAACRAWLKANAVQPPGPGARPVARLDGRPGTVLVLADRNHWVGCETAYARNGGEGSVRKPERIRPSGRLSADAFAVAGNLIRIGAREHDYYWAAGIMPAGVTRVTYTFPDGKVVPVVTKGRYWTLQHQERAPWRPGAQPRTKIKVTITGANGRTIKTYKLVWGEQTCAQITHGC